MPDEMLMVLDETGTTNRPELEVESDFGVGALVVDPSDVTRLVQTARRIGELVGKRDYKYKHVQKNSEARKEFIDAIQPLTRPSGVYGFFAPGGALLKEKERAIAEMQFLGTDDGGETARTAEAIRNGDASAHMNEFLSFFAACPITYSGAIERRIRVCWDRRTDLLRLQEHCDETRKNFRLHVNFGDLSNTVSFQHVADGELSWVARLAGVLAGDVRTFFRLHGERVWSRMANAVRVSERPTAAMFQPENFANITRVAVVNELLGDADPQTGTKETCMLSGYAEQFIARHLTFMAPDGKAGHIVINRVDEWEIHQIPD